MVLLKVAKRHERPRCMHAQAESAEIFVEEKEGKGKRKAFKFVLDTLKDAKATEMSENKA